MPLTLEPSGRALAGPGSGDSARAGRPAPAAGKGQRREEQRGSQAASWQAPQRCPGLVAPGGGCCWGGVGACGPADRSTLCRGVSLKPPNPFGVGAAMPAWLKRC